VFNCVYHCKLSFTEAWELPVEWRKWWVERTVEEKRKEAGKGGASGETDPFGRTVGG
jgi:hypothetical protein